MLRFQAFANSEKCHEIIGKMKAIVRADFPIPAIEEAAWRLAKSTPRERLKSLIEIANEICDGYQGRVPARWQIAFVGAVIELIYERADEIKSAAGRS
jgi:hypothetical protein